MTLHRTAESCISERIDEAVAAYEGLKNESNPPPGNACMRWVAAFAHSQQISEAHVVPLAQSGVRTLDKRVEAVRGDRTKAGPFVIRIRAEAGYIIMPHTHPVDENIVVRQGSWALGMGERFARQKLEPMEPSTFGFAAKTIAHFALSRTNNDIFLPEARALRKLTVPFRVENL